MTLLGAYTGAIVAALMVFASDDSGGRTDGVVLNALLPSIGDVSNHAPTPSRQPPSGVLVDLDGDGDLNLLFPAVGLIASADDVGVSVALLGGRR